MGKRQPKIDQELDLKLKRQNTFKPKISGKNSAQKRELKLVIPNPRESEPLHKVFCGKTFKSAGWKKLSKRVHELNTFKLKDFIEAISPFLTEHDRFKKQMQDDGCDKPLPYTYRNTDFKRSLRDLDELSINMLEDNEWVVKTEFAHAERVVENTENGSFEYILRTKKVIPGKPKKPHPKKADYPAKKFIETWKSDGFIDEITDEHCLIFNKFAECDRHLLVITKNQVNQTKPLNVSDFKAALFVQKSLKSFLFFNCGFESGGSMNHKHIQLMPYSIIDGPELIPLEQAALNYLKESGCKEKMFTLPVLSNIAHVFYKLDRNFYSFDFESVLDSKAEQIHKIYRKCHQFLDNEEISAYHAYNMVLCKNFLFVALRTTDSFQSEGKHIAMGGKAFVGVPIANDEQQREMFRKKGLIKILEQVCVPAKNLFKDPVGKRPVLKRTFTV